MPTTEQIEKIVRTRQSRLPMIKKQQVHLQKILDELNEVDGLLGIIRDELRKQQGPYYTIIAENPKTEKVLTTIDTKAIRDSIREQLVKLDILSKRFGRDTIRIAMIGYERQGKSTFLKAISGLKSDKVIPAFAGLSCTGAVSVIHNISGPFRVEIEPYSLTEFLEIVQDKLRKFFPERSFVINEVRDLSRINLDGFYSDDLTLNREFAAFKNAYCEHVEEYCHLLGQETITLTDESEVVKYVAQYDRYNEPREGYKPLDNPDETPPIVYQKNYYKYVAIKNVNIYKEFSNIDSRRIELVDTVGLGDSSDASRIEEEMFRVLREDCDAAVNLFRPNSSDSLNKQQLDILKKIQNSLQERNPSKWIVYVINKIVSGNNANVPTATAIIEQYNEMVRDMPRDKRPVAWAKLIDGKDENDVQQNLIMPLLNLIISNLSELDNGLLVDANQQGDKIFSQLFSLKEAMARVVSGSTVRNANEGKLFDDKFAELFDALSRSLRVLDEENYLIRRNQPCHPVAKQFNHVIDSLYDALPDKDVIERQVDLGIQNASGIFDQVCNLLYNNIFDQFESVTEDVITPLREGVKMDMVRCLFENGMMGKVPLRDYSVKDGPNLEWLRCLMAEKVTSDAFPELHSLLEYVESYHFNIEDAIEFDVAKSTGIIDQLNGEEYIPYRGKVTGTVSERTDAIFHELFNRIAFLQDKLRKVIGNFTLMPSHSFSVRVQKFRLRIVRNESVQKELREFCREHCYVIWRDDFNNIEERGVAFGNWNKLCNTIGDLCNKEDFLIKNI